jgi:hypothetical protein
MSSVIEAAPEMSGSPPELDYCERVSAYLGLSIETVMSMAKSGAIAPFERRDRKRSLLETVRPARAKPAGAPLG